jgi:antitoxin ParD1/3/4
MQTMNISLPDPLKRYIEEQVSAGGYSSVSEYVRELLRADQQRKAEARLEELVLEGLQSESLEVTPEMWEELHQTLRARAQARHNVGR